MNKGANFWRGLGQAGGSTWAGALAALLLVAVLLAGALYFAPRAVSQPWGLATPQETQNDLPPVNETVADVADVADVAADADADADIDADVDAVDDGADVDDIADTVDDTANAAVDAGGGTVNDLAPAAQTTLPALAVAATETPQQQPRIDLSGLINTAPLVQRSYGYDYNPNSEDYRFHRGTDLEAAEGQPIFAPAAGTVLLAEQDAYWGGIVLLEHQGWQSKLCCVTPRVEVGQQVAAGDFIASVATAPAEAAQGSHFHVEVIIEEASQNPALYF